jgi:hypothetical protein
MPMLRTMASPLLITFCFLLRKLQCLYHTRNVLTLLPPAIQEKKKA